MRSEILGCAHWSCAVVGYGDDAARKIDSVHRSNRNEYCSLQSTAGAAEAGSEKEEALLRRAAMMAGSYSGAAPSRLHYSSMQAKAEAVSGARTLP